MINKISIYSLTLDELSQTLVTLNLKKHNAIQIYQWIYQSKCKSFDEMTNIAKQSREILKNSFEINRLKMIKQLFDPDGTVKFLFELKDKQLIETVLMKFNYGYSVCISSQVGCNMGCKFCASGLLKKIRNLSIDEMILQYVEVQNFLEKKSKQNISNIVIMGIGEPFDNYENVKNTLNIFNNHYGIAIGNRHITVSTCGVVPKIIQFAKDFPQVNLAISLHSANDEIRNQLMPINRVYNLKMLMEAINEYTKIANRRISFEYILLNDVNDKTTDALALVKLLKHLLCYVNIIIYNNVNESKFKPSLKVKAFMEVLKQNHVMVTKRLERGNKINAACGQLRSKEIN